MEELARQPPQGAKEALAPSRRLPGRWHSGILAQGTPAKKPRVALRVSARRAEACLGRAPRPKMKIQIAPKGVSSLQIDDHLKRLLRELGHAINDTVSDSERISDAIGNVRTAGYDIVLKLDATIGLARREANPGKITQTDRRFLESLHIQVDQESLQEETREATFEVTPQDLRFLKSLKISIDEQK